ncbi:hypothetical protein ACWDSJ_24990 [Nocardia sp. NPDC003482]
MNRKRALLASTVTISGIAAFIFSDFEPAVKFIVTLANADVANPATVVVWASLFLRVAVFLAVILAAVLVDALMYRRKFLWHKSKKRYHIDDVIAEIKSRETKLPNLLISGYSFGFAQSIRLYLTAIHTRRWL